MHFSKKNIIEIIILVSGAFITEMGRRQDQAMLFGLGVMVIGCGILVGAASIIIHKEIHFYNKYSRSHSFSYTGISAVAWGMMLLITAFAVVGSGIGLAFGMKETLKQLLMTPGSWLIMGGFYAAFTTFAWSFQSRQNNDFIDSLFKPLRYLSGFLVIIAGLSSIGIGVWGLQEPEQLLNHWESIRTSTQDWIHSRK